MRIQLPHDIIEPAPIGWWPLAPGWWMLIVMALLVLAIGGRWYWRRRQALAPLRQALREYRQIAAHWHQQRDPHITTAALSALLKRVARHYHRDETIAKLTGATWQEFLVRSGAGAFDTDSAAALAHFYQTPAGGVAPPLSACERWLKAQRKMAMRSTSTARATTAPAGGAPHHV